MSIERSSVIDKSVIYLFSWAFFMLLSIQHCPLFTA